MTDLERRINSCIDHINTAIDLDPWAQELAEQALRYMLFMSSLHNCNDCGRKGCDIRPEWGKAAMVNCYKWEEKHDATDINVGSTIGRQAVYDILARYDSNADPDAIRMDVEDLPSAQPEPKTGMWLDAWRSKSDGTRYWYRMCSECGYERNDCDSEKDSNFCPNCGADMKGEQNESNK